MQLIINKKVYTDNSNEADENSVFVVSKQNEKFKDNAIENGCKEIIDSSELKNHIDLSSIKIILLKTYFNPIFKQKNFIPKGRR